MAARVGGILQFGSSMLRPRAQLAAENLFLRKQLALYLERQVKPRRADDSTRLTLVALSGLIDWRGLLTVVKPQTLIRWHRKGFRLFWRWKSRSHGRPRLPANRAMFADILGLAREFSPLGAAGRDRSSTSLMPARFLPSSARRDRARSVLRRSPLHECTRIVVGTAVTSRASRGRVQRRALLAGR